MRASEKKKRGHVNRAGLCVCLMICPIARGLQSVIAHVIPWPQDDSSDTDSQRTQAYNSDVDSRTTQEYDSDLDSQATQDPNDVDVDASPDPEVLIVRACLAFDRRGGLRSRRCAGTLSRGRRRCPCRHPRVQHSHRERVGSAGV